MEQRNHPTLSSGILYPDAHFIGKQKSTHTSCFLSVAEVRGSSMQRSVLIGLSGILIQESPHTTTKLVLMYSRSCVFHSCVPNTYCHIFLCFSIHLFYHFIPFFFLRFLSFSRSSVLYSFVPNRPSNPSKDLHENRNSSLIFKAPVDRATPLQGKHINNYNFISHSHISPTAKNLAPQGLLKISKIVSQCWFGTVQSNKKWLTDSVSE